MTRWRGKAKNDGLARVLQSAMTGRRSRAT